MTEDKLEENGGIEGIFGIAEIGLNDAIQRSGMWADFAHEFLRLGMLADTMRGQPGIGSMALSAARLCRDMIDKELKLADQKLTFLNRLLGETPSPPQQQGLSPSEARQDLPATEADREKAAAAVQVE